MIRMLDVVLATWGAATSAAWCAGNLTSLHQTRRLRHLRDVAADPPASWPRLSVVIAACNEATTLALASASLLAVDYPDLEVVLVDDRSTDGTGVLVDRIAAGDPRVQPVHISQLPEGWLGKVHALEVGAATATGEWLLFTDADVHFEPAALRRAVALCVAEEIDHLVVMPDVESRTILEEAVIDAVGDRFLRKTRAARIGEPGCDAYAGIGAFNLVRRAALERSEGFSWLRMEVVDDVGLGLLLRRAGARSAFVLGDGAVQLRWYSSMGDMARGFEKNLFGFIAHYRWHRVAGLALGTVAMALGPLVALVAGPAWVRGLGAAALATLLVTAAILARRTGRRLLPMLLLPVGHLVLVALVVRSALACGRHRGIVWRGTLYPLAVLRAEQRVRL